MISGLEKKDIVIEDSKTNQHLRLDTTKSKPANDYTTFKTVNLSWGLFNDKTGFSLFSATLNIPLNIMKEAYIGFSGLVTTYSAEYTTAGGLKLYYIKSKISIYSILSIQRMHSGAIFSSGSIRLSLKSDKRIQLKLGGSLIYSLTEESSSVIAFLFGGITLAF